MHNQTTHHSEKASGDRRVYNLAEAKIVNAGMGCTTAFSAVLVSALLVGSASGVTFTKGSIMTGPDGHRYQRVDVGPDCASVSYLAVRSFAAAEVSGTMHGHLLTIESSSEFSWFGANSSVLAATGPSNGAYFWDTGPSQGTSVPYFYNFYPAPRPGCTSPYGPFVRLGLRFGSAGYESLTDILWTRVCGNPGVGCGGASLIFWIEFEPDAVAPRVSDVAPSSGEVHIGLPTTISWRIDEDLWVMNDGLGTLETISIYLSRSGPGGPFEEIIQDLPVTSLGNDVEAARDLTSYEWTITGPATTNAFIRIVGRDDSGNEGAGLSGSAFSIAEPPVDVESRTFGSVKAIYR